MANIQLPKKLEPLFQPARYKVLYGGRGGAKSWGVARTLLTIGTTKRIRVLCAREIQKTIADSVHKLLADQIAELGLSGFYTVQETTIFGPNGTEFVFAGIRGQDIAKIKSFEGVDVVWVEEAQTVSKKSWDVLIPTIRKPGSEIWMTFNPDLDTDETYRRFVEDPPEGAVLIPINWQDNPWFPDVLARERDDLKRRDPIAYENVWEGKCRPAVEGAIYGHEVAALGKRVCNVPYDPMLKVHAVWDLGWNDKTSIIMVQRHLSEVRIIDYIEDSFRTLADYASDLKNKPYNWGTDWLPHDGTTKSIQTGVSPEDILKKLGRRVSIVPKLDVEMGIKRARLVFPRCYFDKEKTVRLRECLKRYRRAIPVNTGEPAAPLHDEFSHGADAFRYLCTIADKTTNDDSGFNRKLDYSRASAGIV